MNYLVNTCEKLIFADKTAIQKLSDKMQSYHFFPEKWSRHLGAATKVIIDLSHDYQLHPGYQITEATNISSRPIVRMSAQWGVTHQIHIFFIVLRRDRTCAFCAYITKNFRANQMLFCLARQKTAVTHCLFNQNHLRAAMTHIALRINI